jgi:predicted lipid-binding transport protein (Tim44 family)
MAMDILFFMIVSGVLMYRLWTILGTRNGNEKDRSFIILDDKKDNLDNIAILPEKNKTLPNPDVLQAPIVPEYQRKRLSKVIENMPDFDPDEFLENAELAYEIIIEAFAKEDKESLKNFLSENVYNAFERALDIRQKNKLHSEIQILEFISTDIEHADVRTDEEGDRTATITVLFKTKQIAVTYDEHKNIVENPAKISVIQKDEWTFQRSCKTTNPTWLLIKTKMI